MQKRNLEFEPGSQVPLSRLISIILPAHLKKMSLINQSNLKQSHLCYVIICILMEHHRFIEGIASFTNITFVYEKILSLVKTTKLCKQY